MMSTFLDKLRLKEQADEDLYFAKIDRELIADLHRKSLEKVADADSKKARKLAGAYAKDLHKLADKHLKDHEALSKSYMKLLKKILKKE